MSEERVTRREIIKRAAYIAPIIITIPASFSFASAGSGDYYGKTDRDRKNQDNKEKQDHKNSFLDLTNKTRTK